MDKDVYAAALRNALTEIRNVCPDVSCSFILTKEGTIVAGDAQADETTMEKAVHSFQSILEKAVAVGGLDTYLIEGKNGKVYLSHASNMYLTTITSKNADIAYLRSITRVIIPTILKLLESIVPTPSTSPKSLTSQQLVVESFSSGGFMGRFAGDTVEVNREILEKWSELFNGKGVDEVEIEAFSGKLARCKVRAINDPEIKRMGIIKVPEKTCQNLEVKKGELVRVKPIASQKSTSSFALFK